MVVNGGAREPENDGARSVLEDTDREEATPGCLVARLSSGGGGMRSESLRMRGIDGGSDITGAV